MLWRETEPPTFQRMGGPVGQSAAAAAAAARRFWQFQVAHTQKNESGCVVGDDTAVATNHGFFNSGGS